MFEAWLLESTNQRLKARTRFYFLATTVVYSFLVLALMVGGIMRVSPELREPLITASLIASPPPPPPARKNPPRTAKAPRRIFVTQRFVAPTTLPSSLPPGREAWPEVDVAGGMPDGVPGGTDGGVSNGILNGVLDSNGPTTVPVPPQPDKETASPAARPRQVSSGVLQGNAIRRVPPIYPAMARNARVSGSVQIEVVIDERGSVISASVMQGHPLLSRAALEAARQWTFRPTLLNGVPIKVTGVLVFNFKL